MPSHYRVGAEFTVNSLTAEDQGGPAIAGFADGGYLIAWFSRDLAPDGSLHEIKAQLFDADGTRAGAEFQVNSVADGWQFSPSIAVLSGGTFVVAWVTNDPDEISNKGINARLFSRSGMPIGDEFKVNLSTGHHFSSEVVALANGGFVISWDQWPGFDKKAQIFNDAGERVGGIITLNTNTDYAQEHGDLVALAGGGFVATWRTTDPRADGDRYAVKAQIFDAAGGRVGSEFLVNSYAVGYQNTSSVAALAGGGFVVVWDSQDGSPTYANDGIRAQLYGPAGDRIGGEFPVNAVTADIVGDPIGTILNGPVVTSLPDGGFMVAWTHLRIIPGANLTEVKAQAFDASGAKVGGEFVVNSVTAGSQNTVEIATLADGRVIVAWGSAPAPWSDRDIQAQIFAPNAAPNIVSDGGAAAAALQVAENAMAVTILAATDVGGPDPVRYAIAGGADAGLFAIDAETGALSFVDAPDYESPADAGADNVYEVIVAASDGELGDTQSLAVRVTNVMEGHVIIGTAARNTIATTKTVPGQPFATKFEDALYGLAGADTLLGGGGADRFILIKISDSRIGAADLITDFGRGDRISLGEIDANTEARGNQSFAFIGIADFSGVAGQLRFEQVGGDTFVTGDVNGDRVADFQIQLQGLIALTSADFIL